MTSQEPDITTNELYNQLHGLQHQLFIPFANIERKIDLPPSSLKPSETDTDHTYTLAMSCWMVISKLKLDLDAEKAVKYALVHDLLEVYTGDVSIFGDPIDLASKRPKEARALHKIKQSFPFAEEITNYINNFQAKSDQEAKFVYALDKIVGWTANSYPGNTYYQRRNITRDMFDQARDKLRSEIEAAFPALLPLFDVAESDLRECINYIED